MSDSYKTISKEGTSDFRDRGSKFLGYAFHCEEEQSLKAKIELRKKHHASARHFCYGAVLDFPTREERSNDHGEPSGSAGLPILNQILSAELANTAVVVVRHFGGTKLGKAGLINAYKESAKQAIDNAKTTVKTITDTLCVVYNYDDTGEVIRAIDQFDGAKIFDQTFTQQCKTYFSVPKSRVANALLLFDHLTEVHVEKVAT